MKYAILYWANWMLVIIGSKALDIGGWLYEKERMSKLAATILLPFTRGYHRAEDAHHWYCRWKGIQYCHGDCPDCDSRVLW